MGWSPNQLDGDARRVFEENFEYLQRQDHATGVTSNGRFRVRYDDGRGVQCVRAIAASSASAGRPVQTVRESDSVWVLPS